MNRHILVASIFAVFLCFLFVPVHAEEAENGKYTPKINTYIVKKGDTLWGISRSYHTTVKQLKDANNLTSDLILIGQRLVIPSPTYVQSTSRGAQTIREESKRKHSLTVSSKETIQYSSSDYEWLAKIIEAEAGGESYLGKVAVGSVVINRVNDKNFPDSIEKVIFQKTGKVYQFSPVGNGRIYRVKPSKDAYAAAQAALNGQDPTKGALYFYNPKIAKSSWIRTREVSTVIGQHNFAF